MNRLLLFLGVGVVAAALGTPRASMAADRWENNDNGPWQPGFTDNELTPGSVQEHDMEGAADEDWLIVSQRPYSSYEARVDGMSDGLTLTTAGGDILAVDLVESDGTVVATGYTMNPVGVDRRVPFRNDTATANDDQQVRISSPYCNPCSALGSGYTIRLFDTTYTIPRFNNSATQVTVMILQNSSSGSVAMTAHFFNASGTLLASQSQSIAAHGTYVVNTTTIAGLAGTSGSIIVTNSGGHGVLSGKAVAVEPRPGSPSIRRWYPDLSDARASAGTTAPSEAAVPRLSGVARVSWKWERLARRFQKSPVGPWCVGPGGCGGFAWPRTGRRSAIRAPAQGSPRSRASLVEAGPQRDPGGIRR
jgi:hypothetical protein